ncbi:hypothetical protein YIM_28800 [Amycolatopsis sp. YIM 10]|nr:hypothetical protein YIM_28800 [Amycolatopsis sp. YIM 10]
MPIVHCGYCCFRVKLTQRSTLPVHYTDATEGWSGHGAQKPCKGAGKTHHWVSVYRCDRPRSGRTCPCCGRKRMTLNKNGKYPAHKGPDGSSCSMSDANNS